MKVSCPNCGQHYEVDQAYVGYNVVCEACGTEFQVSQSSAAIETHTMPEASSSPDESANQQGEATLVSTQPSSGMKPLVCEMCGSSELVKRDGVFICQSCGTKYSVEEAKKMMLTGTVNVTGTVKVDKTGKLENLKKLARRERETGNLAAAVEYYKQILLEDADNWEAYFYSEYCSVLNVDVITQWPVVEKFIAETIPTFVNMASVMSDSSEREFAYETISNEISSYMLFVRDRIVKHYDTASNQFYIYKSSESKVTENRNCLLLYIARSCYALGDLMLKKYKAKDAAVSTSMFTNIWKAGVEINGDYHGNKNERQAAIEAIRYYDSSYNAPKLKRRANRVKAWLIGIGLFVLFCCICGQSENAGLIGLNIANFSAQALGGLLVIYLLCRIVKWIIKAFR